MKKKTKDNVYKAFVGEAKAYFRLLAYAEKAEEEDVPQIAALFRAVAEAERVHATRMLNLVRDVLVKDTDTNLEKSFQREKSVSENEYPALIKDAEDEHEEITLSTEERKFYDAYSEHWVHAENRKILTDYIVKQLPHCWSEWPQTRRP